MAKLLTLPWPSYWPYFGLKMAKLSTLQHLSRNTGKTSVFVKGPLQSRLFFPDNVVFPEKGVPITFWRGHFQIVR